MSTNAHLIKHGRVIENIWQTVELPEEGEAVAIPTGPVLLPWQIWVSHQHELSSRSQLGLWLEPDVDLSVIESDLPQFQLVAIHFPKFSDGRGYSLARLLRERYGYAGEIRAVGDVLHDQLFFLARVGFDAFALRGEKNVQLALEHAFTTFSTPYQHANDIKSPLFRRRSV
jgi:uncharacterized protein (DUF934 family)